MDFKYYLVGLEPREYCPEFEYAIFYLSLKIPECGRNLINGCHNFSKKIINQTRMFYTWLDSEQTDRSEKNVSKYAGATRYVYKVFDHIYHSPTSFIFSKNRPLFKDFKISPYQKFRACAAPENMKMHFSFLGAFQDEVRGF